MTDRPWSVQEAAEYLGVGAETVRRWARAGKLAAFGRLPGDRGEWRFDPAAVRAMLGPRPATQARAESASVVRAQLVAALHRSRAGRHA